MDTDRQKSKIPLKLPAILQTDIWPKSIEVKRGHDQTKKIFPETKRLKYRVLVKFNLLIFYKKGGGPYQILLGNAVSIFQICVNWHFNCCGLNERF